MAEHQNDITADRPKQVDFDSNPDVYRYNEVEETPESKSSRRLSKDPGYFDIPIIKPRPIIAAAKEPSRSDSPKSSQTVVEDLWGGVPAVSISATGAPPPDTPPKERKKSDKRQRTSLSSAARLLRMVRRISGGKAVRS